MPAPILIVSGPPGAGKTTVARRLVETAGPPAAHLHTDDFYNAIRPGYVAPWLAESHGQNTVVTRAIVAAAAEYAAGGYFVVVDGVVGPWFLDVYREAAGRLGVALDYVVLRPDRETAVARARDRDRDEAPLAPYPPGLYENFADLGALEAHVVDSGAIDADALAAQLRGGLAAGRFRL
ncbi:MAG TPA: AAA family ATPase [Caulobacteraceae bacterium]|nr:AAA family ATPase [Caulobacteraceae bacterium]